MVVHRGSAVAGPLRDALAERPARRRLAVSVHGLPANYVASEESALVHWLQGGPAKPLHVPPRPFERGVDGRPTLINNVETLAHLALIARHGANWFREVGHRVRARHAPGERLGRGPAPWRHRGALRDARSVTCIASAGGSTEAIGGFVVGGYFGTWVDPAGGRQSAPHPCGPARRRRRPRRWHRGRPPR